MRVLGILLMLLVLTSCKNYSGSMSVEEEITINHSTYFLGRFGRSKERVIPAGNYEVDIRKLATTGRLKMRLRGRENFTLRIPMTRENRRIPMGEFFISAEDTKQDYDISGRRSMQTSYNGTTTRQEKCYITTEVERCRTVCHGRRDCHSYCEYVTERYTGTQDVTYRKYGTTDSITFSLLLPGSDTPSANFSGSHYSTSEREIDRTDCRLY